jgi:hypothetical protein
MNRFERRLVSCGLGLVAILSGQLPYAAAVDVAFEGTTSNVLNYSDAGADLGNEGFWFANFNRNGGVNNAPPTENAVNATPAYVTMTFGNGVDSAGGWGGYDTLTLPSGTSGLSGALEINNEGAPDRSAGSQHEYMTLTFGAGAPSNLLLGVVVDNTDGDIFSNNAILVNGVSSGALTNNQNADVLSYRLSSISSGDTVRIDGLASTANTVAHMGGFLLDGVIPEPSTGALVALVAGSGFFARRRRGR